MPNTYKDRGLMKWAPFDALTGIDNLLNEIRYRRNKIDKPLLSDDQIEEINRTLVKCIHFNNEVTISYFSDGYIKETFCLIKRIDKIENLIYTNSNEIIHMNDLLNVVEV